MPVSITSSRTALDHILFVTGLFLFSARIRPLLWQITMFTIAHSLTLAMAMTGLIELPARVVEPLIALSIACVGSKTSGTASRTKSRLVLVFGFRFAARAGFASMLSDFGMPDRAFATALISFNVGVEGGSSRSSCWLTWSLGLWFGTRPYYRSIVAIPGSLVISAVGLY